MNLVASLKPWARVGGILALIYFGFMALLFFRQRSLLYHPGHRPRDTTLQPWMDQGRTIGFCRAFPTPSTIWLMLHGNAGQAAGREYVLPRLNPQDSLYVLEYPGYGQREGHPSMASINLAAVEAYQVLRRNHPNKPICILGESLGSGPACVLSQETPPPDKITLVVPYDRLANVAASRFPIFPVRRMLWDAWDNIAALKHYRGPVDIFAAPEDEIIPFDCAKALAESVPTSKLVLIPGGHNDWSHQSQVQLTR